MSEQIYITTGSVQEAVERAREEKARTLEGFTKKLGSKTAAEAYLAARDKKRGRA